LCAAPSWAVDQQLWAWTTSTTCRHCVSAVRGDRLHLILQLLHVVERIGQLAVGVLDEMRCLVT
jgi:hypothetical protein